MPIDINQITIEKTTELSVIIKYFKNNGYYALSDDEIIKAVFSEAYFYSKNNNEYSELPGMQNPRPIF